MTEFTRDIANVVSLYLLLLIPVVLLILFFLKYPKYALRKQKEKRVKNAIVNDRVLLRSGEHAIVTEVLEDGVVEVKFEDGKHRQYAWWGIERIEED